MNIIDDASSAIGQEFSWSFGGGTALMLQIDHRESHDVDLFIDDPQVLPFLNPETQGYRLTMQPDGYDTDGTRVTKLLFDNIGEIDFICSGHITDAPSDRKTIRSRDLDLEVPSEIIAKKIQYRGAQLQPRDMFDLAAVTESLGSDYVHGALTQCDEDRLAAALEVTRKMDPAFASGVNKQLMFRKHTSHLVESARSITETMLAGAQPSACLK